MLKATVLMSALALALAMPAKAASDVVKVDNAQAQVTHQALPDDVVGVESHRSPAGAIVGDAIGGAIVGGLVGGGVAFYNRYGTNGGNGSWGNWQRDVLVGAGIGLGVGLIVGGIDAASNMDRSYQNPIADQRSVGFGSPLATKALRF